MRTFILHRYRWFCILMQIFPSNKLAECKREKVAFAHRKFDDEFKSMVFGLSLVNAHQRKNQTLPYCCIIVLSALNTFSNSDSHLKRHRTQIFFKKKKYPDKTLLYPSFKSRDGGQLAKNSSGSVITRAKQIRIKSLDVHISFDMSSLVSRQYLLPSHTIRHIRRRKEKVQPWGHTFSRHAFMLTPGI